MKSDVSLFIATSQRNTLIVSAIVLLATAFSLAMTGFQFGSGNNVFHIAYVLRSSELSVFHGDIFYQSLEKFTSLIWPMLRLFSRDQNVSTIFFASFVVSRATTFLALVWFFKANGATSVYAILVSLLVCAVSPWLTAVSAVGGHGLFIDYFTQTEMTWGPLIAALVAAQFGRLTLAAVFTGIVFSINAFVGIWLVAILTVIALANVSQRTDRRLLVKASLAFLLVSLPVALWINGAIGSKTPIPPYSYIQYVRIYFPDHFLIESASFRSLRELALLLYCGIVAAFLHPKRRFWVSVLAACFALLVIGSILPYVMNDRFIFSLHFLRAAGVLQFLVVVLMISASVGVLFGLKNATSSRVAAALTIGSLMSMQRDPLCLLVCAASLSYLALIQLNSSADPFKSLPGLLQRRRDFIVGLLVFIAILADFIHVGLSSIWVAKWILILCIIFSLAGDVAELRNQFIIISILWAMLAILVATMAVVSRDAATAKSNEMNGQNIEMTKWLRGSQLVGPFLFPVDGPHHEMFDTFQLRAQKTVWVDWKQGAAVMWEPAFYWQWMPRFLEVRALHTVKEFAEYAVKNRIPYIVLPRSIGDCRADAKEIFQNKMFVICSTKSD